MTILRLTNQSRPRRLEWWGDNRPHIAIYADAFFDWKGTRYKASQLADQEFLEMTLEHKQMNSWGVLMFVPGRRTHIAFRGEIPFRIMTALGRRRAFIYFSESAAKVFAVASFAHLGFSKVTCYIDNEAARCALTKGFGREDSVNALISIFWAMATNTSTDVRFERAPTEFNPSGEISRDKWGIVPDCACHESSHAATPSLVLDCYPSNLD
jgi:hypothetical protein